MIAHLSIYDEIAEFMASMDPAKVINFFASSKLQERFEDLLYKEKEGIITTEEKAELDRHMMMNHIISLAKLRARRLLAQ